MEEKRARPDQACLLFVCLVQRADDLSRVRCLTFVVVPFIVVDDI